jgi:hypothetical protein
MPSVILQWSDDKSIEQLSLNYDLTCIFVMSLYLCRFAYLLDDMDDASLSMSTFWVMQKNYSMLQHKQQEINLSYYDL